MWKGAEADLKTQPCAPVVFVLLQSIMNPTFMNGKGADKNCGHFQIFGICGHAAQGEPARAARPPSRPGPASKKDTTEHVILFTGFTEKLENTKITTEPANMQLMVHTEGMASYF